MFFGIIFRLLLKIGIIALIIVEVTYLSVGFIDGCPGEHIELHKLGTHGEIGPVGTKGTITITGLDAIDIATALGDDVDNSREGHITIKRRGRTTEHLDMIDLLGRDGVTRDADIIETVIEPVTILHNQNEFLTIGIGVMHGEVLTRNRRGDLDHARHIGCKNLIKTLVIAQLLNHLGRDDGNGRRRLVDTLTLTGGRGDGGSESLTDFSNHVDKPWGIIDGGGVIRILLQHEGSIATGLIGLIEGQTAEREQTVASESVRAAHALHTTLEHGHGFLYLSYIIRRLGLSNILTASIGLLSLQ